MMAGAMATLIFVAVRRRRPLPSVHIWAKHHLHQHCEDWQQEDWHGMVAPRPCRHRDGVTPDRVRLSREPETNRAGLRQAAALSSW